MSAPPTVTVMWRRRIAALALAALLLILLVYGLQAAFGVGDDQTVAPLPVTTTPPSLPGDAGARDEQSAARRRARSREVAEPATGAPAAPGTPAPVAPAAPAGSGAQAPAASDGSSGSRASEGVKDSQTGGAGPAPDRDTGGAAAP